MNDMTVAQPINGRRGATVAGPRNIPLEAQVPDIFAAPLTDHGSIPNLHFFAFAHNRLEDGGWAREVTVREMPAMKELAIVNMRLGPGVVRELHWLKRPSGPTRPVRQGSRSSMPAGMCTSTISMCRRLARPFGRAAFDPGPRGRHGVCPRLR